MKNIRNLILRHTKVSRDHLTPEIPLRLITSESDLWHCKPEDVPFEGEPFWGFYWPGGQGISRYILDGAENIRNKNVLDIGSGCGACSIAAIKAGAKTVLANDIDKEAALAIEINSLLNNVSVEINTKNLIGSDCEHWDTLLIGDMFYDEDFGSMLFEWLKKLSNNGKKIYIGDPGRHCLTEKRLKFLSLVAKYELDEKSCIENRGFSMTSVWKLNTT